MKKREEIASYDGTVAYLILQDIHSSAILFLTLKAEKMQI